MDEDRKQITIEFFIKKKKNLKMTWKTVKERTKKLKSNS
jgi:hypothetical protein